MSSMMKKLLIASLCVFGVARWADAAYVPLTVSSGFNADVIANGVGTAVATTTDDVDGVNFCFVANGWQLNSTSTPFTTGLPATGLINSALTAGLTFQLASYSANNDLRLATNTSATLTFQTPAAAQNLYILAVTGSGSSVMTVQVNFTDGSNQAATTINVADWYGGTSVALTGFKRLDMNTNLANSSTFPAGPNLYQYTVPIAAANQSKLISSILVTRISGSGADATLNVFAVSIQEPPVPTTYLPVEITSASLNADVVANGVGTGVAKTNNDVDGWDEIFLTNGWQQTATSTPSTFGLPANGIINSTVVATPGLSFKMAPWATPFEGNNDLRIAANGSSGTLTLASNPAALSVFLLGTSGNGISYFTGQINFTDGTNQPITTPVLLPDWFDSNTQPIAIAGIGRMVRTTNVLQPSSGSPGNPRLYQIEIPIATANQTKPIASIQITKHTTSVAAAIINIFAVTVAANTAVASCPAPTAPTATAVTTTSATLNWTQTGTPGQWQIKYGPAGFSPATAGTSIFTPTKPYVLNPPLTAATSYDYYVRAVCGAGDTSQWSPVTNFTTACVAPAITAYADSFVCGSGTVTLKASTVAGANIKWYSAATGGTALATGNTFTTPSLTATTTYYISAASGSCESSPRQAVQAQVRPFPTVNLGNDTTICPGITYTLDATNSGATYAWNTGASTPTISVNSAGTYSVLVSLNGCNSSDARNITPGIVPVNNLPAATDLCEGDIATLNAGNTGSTFLWTPGANTTQTINVNTGGIYSVDIKSIHGCVITSSTNVIMRPLPVASLGNDTSICEGSQITLDAGNAGYSFLWNTGAATQTIDVTDSGTYSVTITTPYNCVLTEDKHVAFYPGPRVEGFNFIPLFYEDMGKVRFSALNPTDVASYEWDFGDGSPISLQANPTHIYAASGDYLVTLTVYNSCSSYTVSLMINVDLPTGIVKLGAEQAAVTLYPNPSSSFLTIDNKSDRVKMEEVTIFNAVGAVVYRHKADSGTKHRLSVAGLVSGMYSVRILTDQGFIIRKFEVLK